MAKRAPVRKDPTASDVHVDSIIGAIAPFKPCPTKSCRLHAGHPEPHLPRESPVDNTVVKSLIDPFGCYTTP